jgi:hypothetical protein
MIGLVIIINRITMKRIIIACIVCGFSIPFAFSQKLEDRLNCGLFSKRVEYNLTMGGANIESKKDIEKLFFGDFNSMVEFCYMPSSEVNPCVPSGFRIIRDSLNSSYILEVKRISNYREASKEASKVAKKMQESKILDIPARIVDSLSRDVLNQIWEYNRNISNNKVYNKMYFEELPKHFKVEVKSIPISNQFAEKLYKTMVSFIDNFKAKGVPPSTFDGYSVSFRTVVDDELWSLGIHMPGGNANIMANLCMKIIMNANDNQLDESMDFPVVK